MFPSVLWLLFGLGLLYFGSEWLVRGAADLALSLCIRPVIVGLTVVAFATSSPELIVSLLAIVKGSSGISIGNIIGSNIINIALVLGCTILLSPVNVDPPMVRQELPVLVGITAVFMLFCLDGYLGRLEGAMLLAFLMVYLVVAIQQERRNGDGAGESALCGQGKRYLLIVSGLLALGIGADRVVTSAIFIARQFGFSDAFIGLTVVALGTSLPELATSVVASVRGEDELSVGNIVGSNLFNICLVMGVVGVLHPIAIEGDFIRFDIPMMLALTILLWIFCMSHRLNRVHGLILILFLSAYSWLTWPGDF